jgi:hypothetical protein
MDQWDQCTVPSTGTAVAQQRDMDDNPDRERGAQEEQPGDREAKRAPSNQQDFNRPPEGRDRVPDDEVVKGKRSTESPWMGGG